MRGEFVTYGIAKKLKEIGFNELCIGRYTLAKQLRFPESWKNSEVMGCAAPLWQQAEKWLRKKMRRVIIIRPVSEIHPNPRFLGYQFETHSDKYYKTYESARKAAIKKELESIHPDVKP